ncbi:MAG: hypothetical protein AAFU53_09595 [Cyanobacteria bacterium J06632_3]
MTRSTQQMRSLTGKSKIVLINGQTLAIQLLERICTERDNDHNEKKEN